jgi:hypothetical protein
VAPVDEVFVVEELDGEWLVSSYVCRSDKRRDEARRFMFCRVVGVFPTFLAADRFRQRCDEMQDDRRAGSR